MLASMRLSPQHRHSNGGQNQQTSALAPDAWAPESDGDDEETKPRNSAHELLPKQVGSLSQPHTLLVKVLTRICCRLQKRVALYATVRRRYMEQERADARCRPLGSNTPSPVVTGAANSRQLQKPVKAQVVPGVARAKNEPNEPRRQSGCGVKVYVARLIHC